MPNATRKRKVYFLKNGLVRYWSNRSGCYLTNAARFIAERDLEAMSLSDRMRAWSWTGSVKAGT